MFAWCFRSICSMIQDYDASSISTHECNFISTQCGAFTLLKCCCNAYMQPQLRLFSLDFPANIKRKKWRWRDHAHEFTCDCFIACDCITLQFSEQLVGENLLILWVLVSGSRDLLYVEIVYECVFGQPVSHSNFLSYCIVPPVSHHLLEFP